MELVGILLITGESGYFNKGVGPPFFSEKIGAFHGGEFGGQARLQHYTRCFFLSKVVLVNYTP